MKCARGVSAILGLAIVAGDLPAQGIANANPAVRGSSFSGSVNRAGRSLSFALRPYYGDPFGFGFPYSYSQVTVWQPYRPPTVIIVVPRSESQARDRDGDDKPPEGVVRIRPRREREREQEKVEEEKKAPIPIEPEPKFEPIPPPRPKELPPPAPKPPPPPPRVEPPRDPLAESARHVAVGKEAFAAGEYGRAAFRFRKAAETAPDQPMPQFLLAQALLALGKYRDAVNSIQAGLALDPTWPALGPRLGVLYGPDNDQFATHLEELSVARARHPDDPVLLFLQAYVLWFDGRQNDARLLFEKAATLVPDRKDIDRFLRSP
ncbi:MAG TPA: tetratricopeptide repeat protein [Gemmataceae bacterium]|nr:tetratricopeptide repeat protein [Gemmataceae bacterium]